MPKAAATTSSSSSSSQHPKKQSSSKKSSSNARPINFASVLTAQLSRPLHTAEDWMEEGAVQESSAERYQFGAKAENHFLHALLCYTLSSSFTSSASSSSSSSSSSFGAVYNAARVQLQLAIDFLPREAAWAATCAATAGFREARAELAQSDFERADAGTSWVLALREIGLRMEEGICDGSAAAVACGEWEEWEWEAREVLLDVVRMQRAELEPGSADEIDPRGEQEEVDEEYDVMMMTEEEKTALLESGTTKEGLLETLLALLSLLLSLYTSASSASSSSSSSLDPRSSASLQSSLESTFQQTTDLHALILAASNPTTAPSDQTLELHLLHLQISAALPSDSALAQTKEQIFSRYQQSMHADSSSSIELISQYADWLYDTSSPSSSSFIADLTTSAQAHQQTFQLLADPFRSKKGLQNHALPALLSANRISASTVHLALCLSKRNGSFPEVEEVWRLATAAWEMAIKAVDLSGYGATASVTNSGSGSGRLVLQRSTKGRKDWKTERCFIVAMLHLARCALLLPPPSAPPCAHATSTLEEHQARVQLAHSVLAALQECTGRDTAVEVRRYWEEIGGDLIEEGLRSGELREADLWNEAVALMKEGGAATAVVG